MTDLKYIVVTSRALCSDGGPITIEHYSGCEYGTKKQAVREGFKMYESDDFFIGVLHDGKLAHFEGIKGSRHIKSDDIEEIAGQLEYEIASPAAQQHRRRIA